jgi:hypothetical protein
MDMTPKTPQKKTSAGRDLAWGLGLSGAIMVVLFCIFCVRQPVLPASDVENRPSVFPASSASISHTNDVEMFRKCVDEKRLLLDTCSIACDGSEEQPGAWPGGFDECLDFCAKRATGKPMPRCACLLDANRGQPGCR